MFQGVLNVSSTNYICAMDNKKQNILYIAFKRFFDVLISLIGLVFLLPIILVIKVLYVLNKDYNKIIFTQDRIGKDGKLFKFYKFRTMVPDADKKLEEYLKKNKKAREEYQLNKKLHNDPRITKVGIVIR